MKEKIEVLEHHVSEVECLTVHGKQFLPKSTLAYANNLLPAEFNFSEGSKKEFVQALQKAALAVLTGNVKIIPDFKDKGHTEQNYDLICFACPNYVPNESSCESVKRKRMRKFLDKMSKNYFDFKESHK